MKKILFNHILAFVILAACTAPKKSGEENNEEAKMEIDIQGHRGARGLLPENSIPAFKKALDLGVTTLELDLGVTRDKQLVVTHEPWISAEICRDLEGSELPDDTGMKLNIYQMTYEEVASFDCGTKVHPRFPEQEKIAVVKPRLIDMVTEVEAYATEIGHPGFKYNIEIKSLPQGDNLFHPTPSGFSNLVFETLDSLLDWDRVNIQSFDFRVVRYFHETYPNVELALLIENQLGWKQNLDSLGFDPHIYSPYYQLINQSDIDSLHQRGIKVIPWTINTAEDMQTLIDWGVDGIITDYPNIAVGLTRRK